MSSMTRHDLESGRSDGERRAGRKPRADGVESRRAILHAAANLATTRGLEGLSIGELAQHIGMSKSGLYAHFKSKEEILEVLRQRLERTREEELDTALEELVAIAEDRWRRF